MSLRGRPVEQQATLPDGRIALVRVGIPEDPYIARAELDTVALEVVIDERITATLNTVLDSDQEREANALVRDVVARLESGDLEPTAGALEPLADQLR
jgi:hypothetical protein